MTAINSLFMITTSNNRKQTMEILETLSVTTTFVIKENGKIIDETEIGAALHNGKTASIETMTEIFREYCEDCECNATLEMVDAIESIDGNGYLNRMVTVDLIDEYVK